MEIKIYLLRHPCFYEGDAEIFQELNAKATALLFYLAANRGRVYSRDVLAEFFWPEQGGEKARSNLRQTLSAIKKACLTELCCEESIILHSKGGCRLNEDYKLWVDAGAFYKLAEGDDWGSLQEAVDLYHTGFLQGLNVKGSAALDEWIMFERDRLDRTLTSVCRRLASLYEEQGMRDAAIACLSRLLQINPLQEEIYRELMGLYYKNKDRYNAIAQYKHCVKMLRSELNVGPMEETRQLYDRILYENEQYQREDAEPEGQREAAGISWRGHYLVSEKEGEALAGKLCKELGLRGPCEVNPNPFGPVDFEGFYSLAEGMLLTAGIAKDQPAICRGLSPLFPQFTGDGQGGGGLAVRLYYAVKLLLESQESAGGCVVLFRRFEDLDSKTQELVRFLLGNLYKPSIHLIVTYGSPDEVSDLRRGFEGAK